MNSDDRISSFHEMRVSNDHLEAAAADIAVSDRALVSAEFDYRPRD